MLCHWSLYTVLAPMVVLDMLLRVSSLCLGAWPLGLDYLAEDY